MSDETTGTPPDSSPDNVIPMEEWARLCKLYKYPGRPRVPFELPEAEQIDLDQAACAFTLEWIAEQAHATAVEKGFWNVEIPEHLQGEVTAQVMYAASAVTKLALIHSEVSEAVKAVRVMDIMVSYDDEGKPHGLPIELADIILRTLDFASGFGINITEAVHAKMLYNKKCPHMNGNAF